MAWLTIDSIQEERIFNGRPVLLELNGRKYWKSKYANDFVIVPSGTIESILGRKITIDDCPIFIYGENHIKLSRNQARLKFRNCKINTHGRIEVQKCLFELGFRKRETELHSGIYVDNPKVCYYIFINNNGELILMDDSDESLIYFNKSTYKEIPIEQILDIEIDDSIEDRQADGVILKEEQEKKYEEYLKRKAEYEEDDRRWDRIMEIIYKDKFPEW